MNPAQLLHHPHGVGRIEGGGGRGGGEGGGGGGGGLGAGGAESRAEADVPVASTGSPERFLLRPVVRCSPFARSSSSSFL
jgi:hypothetical protein